MGNNEEEFPMNIFCLFILVGIGLASIILLISLKYSSNNLLLSFSSLLLIVITFVLGFKLEKYFAWTKGNKTKIWQRFLWMDRMIGAITKTFFVMLICYYLCRSMVVLLIPVVLFFIWVAFTAYEKQGGIK